MIEELLYKMESNMSDYITKMEDSITSEGYVTGDLIETTRIGIINEWNYFMPYGYINKLGKSFIETANPAHLMECVYHLSNLIRDNTQHEDVKKAIIKFKKKELNKDF